MLENCTNLESITIPDSVTIIGSNAFFQCVKLGSVRMGTSVTAIGGYAFYGCRALTSIDIPNSVTLIGDAAFSGCSSLTSITIPGSVTAIGVDAFFGCTSLKNLIMLSEILINSGLSTETVLYVPDSMIDTYKERYPNNQVLSSSKFKNMGFSADCEVSDIRPNITQTLSLSLGNAEKVIGFQTELTLPQGLSIAENGKDQLEVFLGEGTAMDSHVLTAAKVAGGNIYRIVAYSSQNETFTSEENLLNITISADDSFNGGDIVIGETTLSLSEDIIYNPEDLTIGTSDKINVSRVEVTPSQAEINIGTTLQLNYSIAPSSAWSQNVIWSSSDESVATVNVEGVVTPIAKGTATITATAADGSGVKDSVSIRVTNYVQTLSIGDDITIEEGETQTLIPQYTPADADLTMIYWLSDDAGIAYVDGTNTLHAVAPGTTIISAVADRSRAKVSISVTVTGVLYGDANDDSSVNIGDVVTDVQYIQEKDPQPFHFKKADVNRDSKIDITDITKTVDIILTQPVESSEAVATRADYAVQRPAFIANDVVFDSDHQATMKLELEGADHITAIQGDIILPDGVTVTNISLPENHVVDHVVNFVTFEDHRVRFVVYSLSLMCFTHDQIMLEVNLKCDNLLPNSMVELINVITSDENVNLQSYSDTTVNLEVTGIDGVGADAQISVAAGDGVIIVTAPDDTEVEVYSMTGLCVAKTREHRIDALAGGVYIVRVGGKTFKVMVK